MKLLTGPAIIILFVSMFVLEALYAICDDHKAINFKDSFVNAVIGLIGLMNSSVVKVIIYATYAFLYRFRIFTIPDTASSWFIALLLSDFSYYWFHRASHTVNWFWASHVVHHSSEHYNISTAMRESWTSNLTGQFLFWCWLPIIGFHPALVVVAIQIVHLYQIWLHTEFIKKLPGLIEYIFNTPSHHRVHHGSNFRYLDKNHGGVLIIWDRLFGTFQAEEETPVYGITKNIHTHNIFRITFHEWQNMFTNIRHSGSIKNAVRYMFRPPGWSHNGSSKTVRQLKTLQGHQPEKYRCKMNHLIIRQFKSDTV